MSLSNSEVWFDLLRQTVKRSLVSVALETRERLQAQRQLTENHDTTTQRASSSTYRTPIERDRSSFTQEVQQGTRTIGEVSRVVQQWVGAIAGVANLPFEIVDTGVAMVGQFVPSVPLPAATMTSLYLGIPHGHGHPPSLIPPHLHLFHCQV